MIRCHSNIYIWGEIHYNVINDLEVLRASRMSIIKVVEKKVGLTRNKKSSRVWFDGAYLLNSGFCGNASYSIDESDSALTLSIDPNGDCSVSNGKRNGKPRPIIELIGDKLGKFAKFAHIKAVIQENKIVISKLHTDEELEVRNQKALEVDWDHSASYVTYDGKNDILVTPESFEDITSLISLSKSAPKCDILEFSNVIFADYRAHIATAMIKTLQPFFVDLHLEEHTYGTSKKEIAEAAAVQAGVISTIKSMGYHTLDGSRFLSNGVNCINLETFNASVNLSEEQFCKSHSFINAWYAKREEKKTSRFEEVKNAVLQGLPITTAGLFHGAGVLCEAISQGIKSLLKHHFTAAVEIEEKALDVSLKNNLLWDRSENATLNQYAINMPIQNVDLSKGGVNVMGLIGGLPCVGASVSGLAKNKLSCAEEHSKAGGLFMDFLNWVNVSNPFFTLIENVIPYKNTASAKIIRSTMTYLFGYKLSERDFSGVEFGALENRHRFVMVGISDNQDLNDFDIDAVQNDIVKPECIGDVIDTYEPNDPIWQHYQYLQDKQVRDIANGKGFRLQWLKRDATHVGVIGTSYSKIRSTEPFELHPFFDNMARLFNTKEHCIFKTIPLRIINDVSSKTLAHSLLGQSVIYEVFVAIGRSLSDFFNDSFNGGMAHVSH